MMEVVENGTDVHIREGYDTPADVTWHYTPRSGENEVCGWGPYFISGWGISLRRDGKKVEEINIPRRIKKIFGIPEDKTVTAQVDDQIRCKCNGGWRQEFKKDALGEVHCLLCKHYHDHDYFTRWWQ